MRDSSYRAFRMSATIREVDPFIHLNTLVGEKGFGGILVVRQGPYILATLPCPCLMFTEHRDSFEQSHQECLAEDKDPLNVLIPDNRKFI
ncbi:hypothetical protein BT96DRAFT_684305 [Gymnopus androsaceus JB14]|uniref:Uncharacterized protein n=1 Tax=Gymnopus androsaceus JB14 TaxID=1447944 RepID=A0A6A4GET1_9AGAR|nr:hypothetical protein BT96DRAFT_684305 [Gymnopus androsaceus JB14]